MSDTSTTPCPKCNGRGYHVNPLLGFAGPLTATACDFCDGTGETNSAHDNCGRITFDCPERGGTGWVL